MEVLIKSDIWLPLLVGGIYLTLNIFLFLLLYDPRRKGPVSTQSVRYNDSEINRQLARQTDILERDRWDRISGYTHGDK